MLDITHVKNARQRKDKDGNVKEPYVCDRNSAHVILPGMPYKWVQPDRFNPKRVRCVDCPDWHIWEVKYTLDTRLAQVAYDFQQLIKQANEPDDVQEALDAAAEAIEEIAGERREGAENIEAGFGHSTTQSEEMAEQADSLEQWAGEIRDATIPERPDPEETDCDNCEGDGLVFSQERETDAPDVPCPECEDGKVTPEEPTEDQIEEWREEVDTDLMAVVDDSPL